MYERIKEFIEEYEMVKGIKNIVVGFSGGADSVCLLLMLKTYIEDTDSDINLTAVHVNHGIRGEEADMDEEFCRELCREENIDFVTYHYDVPGMAKEEHISEEEMGRRLRYAAFHEETTKLSGTSVIAVAHHENDQAETILFNLVRGTGIKGACAMRPVSQFNDVAIIRPLLCVTRKEIEAYLASFGREYVTDSTNLSAQYSRNKIRHHILDFMEQELNPDATKNINAFAKKLLAVDDYMDEMITIAYDKYVEDDRLSCDLIKEHKAILNGVIHRLLTKLFTKDVTEAHIESVAALLELQTGKRIDLPRGYVAIKEYDNILIMKKADVENSEDNPVTVKFFVAPKTEKIHFDDYTKVFDYGKIQKNLHIDNTDSVKVRFRENDDYFYVDNEGHQKKLNQYFIDEKVPQSKRDSLTVVAIDHLVLWTVGMRDTAGFRVTDETTEVLILTVDTEKNCDI